MNTEPVTIASSNKEMIDAMLEVSGKDVSVELLLTRCDPSAGIEILPTAFVSILSAVGTNLFSQWFYDKIKDKPNEKTVINGNQINAKTVTVVQLTQIFNGDNSRDPN